MCRHQYDGTYRAFKWIDGLVSANELRWFWIRWTNDFVEYGKGYRVEQHIIIRHDDLTPFINKMKIRSYKENDGFWIIPQLYYDLGNTNTRRYVK